MQMSWLVQVTIKYLPVQCHVKCVFSSMVYWRSSSVLRALTAQVPIPLLYLSIICIHKLRNKNDMDMTALVSLGIAVVFRLVY